MLELEKSNVQTLSIHKVGLTFIFIEQEIDSNGDTNIDETLTQEDDEEEQEKDDDNVSVESVELNISVVVTNLKTPANSPNSAKKTRILSVRSRPQFTKMNKKKLELEMETGIIVKLIE